MKIPFDIKCRPQIESGEYKVVTSFGEPVEIVKWDCKGQYPLLACIFDGDTDDAAFYTEEGKGVCNSKENYLFIITPEPELSEWQTFISGCLQKYGLLDCGAADRIAKECSAELLELAREKLIEKRYTSDLRKTDAYKLGKAEALKDLPMWKKRDDFDYPTQFCGVVISGGQTTTLPVVIADGYEIPISELLNKLPKEE